MELLQRVQTRSPHHLLVKMALHFRQWRVFGISARGMSVTTTESNALEPVMAVSLIGIESWAGELDFIVGRSLKIRRRKAMHIFASTAAAVDLVGNLKNTFALDIKHAQDTRFQVSSFQA